jgi:dienelactone hydrolase
MCEPTSHEDHSQLSNSAMRFTRVDQTFTSQGLKCGAWLYLPEGVNNPPVVVMAHGFGGQRWMRLPAYAEHFAQRGMAVFVFDYRNFNDSEGQPRNYINPKRHLQDWKAALTYVRTLDEVDTKRIALWGTSFSGGHVIPTAAHDQEIKAVVAQVPFTDGITTNLKYVSQPVFACKAIYHGLADVFAATFTRHRHNVQIAGKPGEAFGMMSTPDAMPGLLKLLGISEKEWSPHNYCPAEIVFTLGFYRPIAWAKKVFCPALIIGAEKDSLFPPDGPEKMADIMQKATYIGLPMGHFDVYVGEAFEKLVSQMGDFLQANLR